MEAVSDIEQRWMVGTADDCDVRVTDEYASAHHCEVARLTNGAYAVRDLGSTNGTNISRPGEVDIKVWDWTPITPGQTLIVGRSKIPWRP
jgi:hypothetical protein